MKSIKYRFSNLCFGFLSIVATTSSHAGISIIVSAPPPAREIVVGPPGYARCYVVQPGFYNGVWHHKHKVCEYESNAGMRMWVTGYWQCGSYRESGVCTGWHWIGSHWANRHDMAFYARPSHQGYHRHNAYTQVHNNEHQHGHGHVHGHGYNHDEHVGHRHGYH